eukprot:1161237-Pelagomonas_calceolata.AAC.7
MHTGGTHTLKVHTGDVHKKMHTGGKHTEGAHRRCTQEDARRRHTQEAHMEGAHRGHTQEAYAEGAHPHPHTPTAPCAVGCTEAQSYRSNIKRGKQGTAFLQANMVLELPSTLNHVDSKARRLE